MLFTALGTLQSAWASARLDDRKTGARELRQALAAYMDQANKLSVPFYQGLLAEIEAQDDAEGALTRIDEALALAQQTGEHWTDAFLHRLRGEISAQARSGECGADRGCVSHRNRRRPTAKGTEF